MNEATTKLTRAETCRRLDACVRDWFGEDLK